jgi:hypothetical protein
VTQETIRERWLGVELAHHLRLLNSENGARRHSRRSCHPLRLARKAALAEEMADIEEGNHSLFASVRQDRQPDGAFLDIHDARGWIALRKDLRCGFVLDAL